MKQITIIGSGPAGLTAAIYAARGGLEPVVISGTPPGGALMNTTDVENYPGFPDGIQGPDLVVNMRRQAERFGTRFLDERVERVDFSVHPFKLVLSGDVNEAVSVILASGSTNRWLGLENETRLRGRGVSSCATCDGFFFRKKDIVVVGGGDSAMEEALFLSNIALSVAVLIRGDKPRASHAMVERVRERHNIRLIPRSRVKDILGDDIVTGVQVITDEGATEILQCSAVFVAIGQVPNTAFLQGQVDLDPDGYVRQYPCSGTSVAGVFVAGDVYDRRYMQAVTAAASGCKAAIECIRYLEEGSLVACPIRD